MPRAPVCNITSLNKLVEIKTIIFEIGLYENEASKTVLFNTVVWR